MATVLTPAAPPAAPASAVTPPPATPAVASGPWPRQHLWTVGQFHTAAEAGTWGDRRPYLIDGIVWEQGPMNPPHAVGVKLLTQALAAVIPPGHHAQFQVPLVVGGKSDPHPDAAIVSGGVRDYLTRHPATAVLVAEVSDSSLTADLTVRAEQYAAAGVSEYWVLDVDGRELHVLRDPRPLGPGGHRYFTVQVLGPADSVSPLCSPAVTVKVADLLP